MNNTIRIGFHLVLNAVDISYYYPLAFSYLKSYLEAYLGHSFEAVLLNSLESSIADAVDILCLSVYSQDFDDAKIITDKFKKLNSNLIIILGGQHITHFPETLPVSVDVGVIGEGEITFLELMRLYAKDKKLAPEALKSIDGLVFRDSSGRLIQTEPRQLIENLDTLALPDRDCYPDDKAPYLFTSRGCPYRCTFCSSSEYWKKVRYFSAEYVCNDIKNICRKKTDLKLLGIWDDLFVDNRTRLREIRDILHNDGIFQNASFEMACQIRAHLVDEDLCKLLQQLHITSVSFGFESVSDKFLSMLKPTATVQNNLDALELLKRFNLPVCCSFIIAVPGETEKDVRNTYELILDLMSQDKLVEPHVNFLMPMPNTIFWKEAEKKGLIDVKNMRWSRLRYFCNFRDSIYKSPKEWASTRLKNNSIYLNEDYLKEERLLELIVHYENKIIREMEERRAQARPPYPHYVYIDLADKNNAHTLMIDKVGDGSCVLECGSLGGHTTRILAQKKCTVDCLEIDKTVAYMAYQFARRVYVADSEDANFLKTLENSSYDFIICGDILEHLKRPADCLMLLKEKLKPDGKIIVSIPNVTHGSIRLKLLKGRFEYEQSGLLDRSHLKFFDFYSMVDLFNNAKLHIDSLDVVRIPLEYPMANIDLSEYKAAVIEEIKQDPTSDVFQYVICISNMTSLNDINNADLLYNQLFPPSAAPIPIAACVPHKHSPAANKSVLSKIKEQINSLICSLTKKEK